MIKIFLLMFVAVNCMAALPNAKEMAKTTNRANKKEVSKCVKEWIDGIDASIKEHASIGDCFYGNNPPACVGNKDIKKEIKKLEALNYLVVGSGHEYIRIQWCIEIVH